MSGDSIDGAVGDLEYFRDEMLRLHGGRELSDDELIDLKGFVNTIITIFSCSLFLPVGLIRSPTTINVSSSPKERVLRSQAGVDLFVVETMMSLAEARAALIAAKEVCDLPVMVILLSSPFNLFLQKLILYHTTDPNW